MRKVAVLMGLSGLFLSLPAGAQSDVSAQQPLRLDWTAPSECPSREQVERDVRRLLGARPSAVDLEASATVRVSSGQYELVLKTTHGGERGIRDFAAESCQTVAKAAALTLALMLNPDPTPATKADPEAPAASEQRVPERHSAKPERLNLDIGIFGALGLNLGQMPLAGPEGAFGVELQLEAVLLGVAGRLSLPQSKIANAETGAGGRFYLRSAGVSTCVELLARQFGVAPCRRADWVHIFGRGTGISDPQAGTTSWFGVGGGVLLSVPVTRRLALRTDLGLAVPLARPRIFIENVGMLQRPSVVHGQLSFGLGLNIH